MAKTLLPLKSILEGDYRSLTQSFREVAQQDNATLDYRSRHTLDHLIQQVTTQPLLATSTSQGLLASATSQFIDDWSIYSTDNPVALMFCDNLISRLKNTYKVHPQLEQSVYRLSLLALLSLTKRNEAIVDPAHPLQQFIEQLYLTASVWEPAGGRIGKAFLNQLCQFEEQLSSFDIKSNEAWKQQVQAITEINQTTSERTDTLEKRLKESSSTDPEALKRQNLVNRWINRKLNNKPLPSRVLLFIRLELIPDLQYLVVQQGEQHPTWSRWQKLLHLFSWIFKDSHNPDAKQKLMSVLLPAIEELDESYYHGLSDTPKYESFLAELSDTLIGIVQGIVPELELYTAPSEEQETAIIRQSIVSDNEDYNEGDWFYFNTDSNDGLRAKLLIKSSEKDSLVFVNFHGKKVHESHFEDFSVQLATRDCRPIRRKNLYKQALYEALKALEIYHRNNVKSRQKELDDIEVAKQRAAEKALEEARLITESQEAERVAQEQYLKRRTEISADELEHYSKQLKELHVGAWLGFHTDKGEILKHKLSVKLAGSGRYIFTDRLGQPVGERNFDDLLDLMINKRLDIIRTGDNFDNRLEKIVQGLRKPKDRT